MNKKTKETIYAIAKGTAGTVPVAGPILSELFGVAFADPASKRRTEILEEMDHRIHALEQKGFNISELADNQEFLTVAM
ncbi:MULTISPECIES: hypothetical protein [Bacillus]|uniref:hypothetical protein n=1 Tax=Bacillus TaxID=1386 RepID=UPI000B2360D1|nr:hypothetical protein [Bacillus cereus]